MTYIGSDRYEVNIGSIKGTFDRADISNLIIEANKHMSLISILDNSIEEFYSDYDEDYRRGKEECHDSENNYTFGFEDGKQEAEEEHNREKDKIKEQMLDIITKY